VLRKSDLVRLIQSWVDAPDELRYRIFENDAER